MLLSILFSLYRHKINTQKSTNTNSRMVYSYWLKNVVTELVYISEEMRIESLSYLRILSFGYSIDTYSLCRQKLKHPQKVQKKLLPKLAKVQLDQKVKKKSNANEKKPIQSTSTRFLNKFIQILVFHQKLCQSCKFISIFQEIFILFFFSIGIHSSMISSNVLQLKHLVYHTTINDQQFHHVKFKQPFVFYYLVN